MPTTRAQASQSLSSPPQSPSAGNPSASSPRASTDHDDDDMEYEATTDSDVIEFFESLEGDEDGEEDGEEDDDEEADQDPDEEMAETDDDALAEVLIEMAGNSTAQSNGEGQTTAQTQGNPRPQRVQVPAQFLRLFTHRGIRQILGHEAPGLLGDDEEDEDYNPYRQRRRRPAKAEPVEYPKVPSDEGRRLMSSNLFGKNDYYKDARRRRSTKLPRTLLNREIGQDGTRGPRSPSAVSQNMLPSATADTVMDYGSRFYSGQFSDDGNFFFCCSQDMKVRMYDTSNPYIWKYYKTVKYFDGSWTITDASLSRDNKYLAYSSIKNVVSLAPTDPNDSSEPRHLDFSNLSGGGGSRMYGYRSGFGIWSIRFSGDGSEIVAGTTDNSVYVYDIELQRSILRIPGHTQHVNAVCFGDSSSPHILYSGSDDTLIKVWDRRSMSDKRAAGVFMGHTEGLTYVDSKGDGRYVLSNAKDQTMKLWDLRKMISTEEADNINPAEYTTDFDYRFMNYSDSSWRPHPHDCSLVTFRGHAVLKTLIRCHFSPPSSTNSRYVYTGSSDGSVYIYNLDATLAGKIDVHQATLHPRARANMRRGYGMRGSGNAWDTCVRDASWHPYAPMIAATSWNGYASQQGTCSTHSWNDGALSDECDSPPMGRRVNHQLQPIHLPDLDDDDEEEGDDAEAEARRRRLRTLAVPETSDDEVDDEDVDEEEEEEEDEEEEDDEEDEWSEGQVFLS